MRMHILSKNKEVSTPVTCPNLRRMDGSNAGIQNTIRNKREERVCL